MTKRYGKREYEAYVRWIERYNKKGPKIKMDPVSFKRWKRVQPVLDEVSGQINQCMEA
jgi:hypothetical protein